MQTDEAQRTRRSLPTRCLIKKGEAVCGGGGWNVYRGQKSKAKRVNSILSIKEEFTTLKEKPRAVAGELKPLETSGWGSQFGHCNIHGDTIKKDALNVKLKRKEKWYKAKYKSVCIESTVAMESFAFMLKRGRAYNQLLHLFWGDHGWLSSLNGSVFSSCP